MRATNVPPQTPYWRVASNGPFLPRRNGADGFPLAIKPALTVISPAGKTIARTNNREQVVSMEKAYAGCVLPLSHSSGNAVFFG